ncbi:MAG: branched-chain amino acid ABC transporter permease [Anaerolineales bacterium]|nr:branched-chain amino acid ABC transporter permease [Anaerolineales bacterium]
MQLAAMWDLFMIGILRGGLYALMAAGLTLVLGVMNISSFMHGELYMIGAYMGWFAFVELGLNPILAILFAALGSFIAGMVIERSFFYPLRRRSKEGWLLNAYLVTVGLSFVLQNAALAIFRPIYRGIRTYWVGSIRISSGMSISVDRFMGFLVAVATIVAFWLFLRGTKIGRAIRAVAQDERGAMLVGIELDRIHTLSFGLSSMLAGIAGASLLSINPAYPTMGLLPLAKSWLVVILAGLGNIRGAIIGGFIVGIVEAASYYFLGAGWQDVTSVTMLIIILLFKPSGLFGTEVKGILER